MRLLATQNVDKQKLSHKLGLFIYFLDTGRQQYIKLNEKLPCTYK